MDKRLADVTRLIEWLLDLDSIRLGRDAPLILKWNSPLAAWVLFGFALLALTFIVLTYRRERVSWGRRIAPAVVRCGIIALVVAVICRPSIVLQRNRVEPSYAVLGLDTSQSMAASEQYSDNDLALSVSRGAGLEDADALETVSRLELVQAALTRDDAAPLRALLARNGLELCTFGGHVETLGFFPTSDTLGSVVEAVEGAAAVDPTTDLAGAISQIVRRTRGRRLAAIVLATDGQSTHPTSLKDAVDLARDRKIPIFPLRIGSTDAPWDIHVGPVIAQSSVFVNDLLAVEAQLTAQGLREPMPVTVRLIEERATDADAVERVVLDPKQPSMTVELRTKPTETGLKRYRVEVAPHPKELTADNNSEWIDIAVLDDRCSVLYVDGYPRYEYRYLKNALLREQTVELSVLLIEADEQFVQEGTDPIRRFPETPEELNGYDLVLFGDVDPKGGWLSPAQMNMLLDFVGNEGGGFGLIAGERWAPRRFLGTPLEKLIPVRIDPSFLGTYEMPLPTGFQAQLTPEGRRSRILRFSADRTQSQRLLEAMPELFWFARTFGPRPGASVLLEHPTIRTAGTSGLGRPGSMPIVVTGRYGAGKLFFQATDDTWRWRRHTGEFLHDTYWVRVVRDLMPTSRVARDRRFVIRTDRRIYPYGSGVRTQVEVFDSQLLAELGDLVRIVVATPDEPAGDTGAILANEPEPDEAANGPEGRDSSETFADRAGSTVVGRFDAHRIGPYSSVLEGTWIPPRPGSYIIQAADIPTGPGTRAASVVVRVKRPDLEARRPEADHDVLERIAAATGGRVLELDELEEGFRAIRDRSVQIPDDIEEPLWDSKLALMLFVGMISMEWVLRKAFGLL